MSKQDGTEPVSPLTRISLASLAGATGGKGGKKDGHSKPPASLGKGDLGPWTPENTKHLEQQLADGFL
jgi:hypothetical protein